MICSECNDDIELCDGCGNRFKKGDKVWHDSLSDYHYCSAECHPDLEEAEVE